MRFEYSKPETLSRTQIDRMFDLMQQYYDEVPREIFERDLREKTDVILLKSRDGVIQGFSTVLKFRRPMGGRNVSGFYSGDTVLNKDYWGSRILPKAFSFYVLKTIVRSPFESHYWFLMSKGYKTYLLMTNNTLEFYPRVGREIPSNVKALRDSFYGEKFGADYDPERGVVVPKANRTRLKDKVADIEPRYLKNRHIRFFSDANPSWKDGTELACIARLNLGMLALLGITLACRQFRLVWRRGLSAGARSPRPAAD
ncbi:MAG: hypothetical protein V4760_09305 [Bdellovibrionota bacterium]